MDKQRVKPGGDLRWTSSVLNQEGISDGQAAC